MIWFAFRWRNCPDSGPPVAITAGESAGARSPPSIVSGEHHLHGYATSTLAQLVGSDRRQALEGPAGLLDRPSGDRHPRTTRGFLRRRAAVIDIRVRIVVEGDNGEE